MVREIDGRADIRAALEQAGYRLVQIDPKVGGNSKRRVDALAYAANADGDLVPWVSVEAKNGKNVTPESLLPALIAYREELGTVEHYAVINGDWYRADRALRSFEAVDGPVAPANDGFGFLTDPVLAASLLSERLWFEADKARGRGARVDYFFPSPELFVENAIPGVETVGGEYIPVRHDVLWQARRRALASFALRRHAEQHANAPVLADAVARVVGARLRGTVLDPFCGTGNFLWSAMDRAGQMEDSVEFVGQEINVDLAQLAEQIGRTGPMLATITTGDSFQTNLPQADVVVTAPPFGGLREPWMLLNGGQSRDWEASALDLCLRHLRPGGRAVFLLPTSVTFRANLESYRRFLAQEFRVGALIGLPSGAVEGAGAAVRSVLLVIDRDEPGEAFVAQLGEDWQAQLSESGGALNAALEHLDGE